MLESIKIAYENRYRLRLVGRVGEGRDGEIFLTDGNTVVKFFKQSAEFRRERQAYEILAHAGVTDVAGHAVPKMQRADENLLAIEMSLVQPPFLLDFASAYPV